MASSVNFDSMTVAKLKDYLKTQNASLSGNKSDLLSRAKLYFREQQKSENPVHSITDELQILERKRLIFEENHEFKDISQIEKDMIPVNFNKKVLEDYLTSWKLYVDNELIDGSTDKPADKGDHLYHAKYIQTAEFAIVHSSVHIEMIDLLIVRARVNASYKQELRFPAVAIQMTVGTIEIATCSCVQKSGGRCAHVAAVLYLVKALRYGLDPLVEKSVTSMPQAWGKGELFEFHISLSGTFRISILTIKVFVK